MVRSMLSDEETEMLFTMCAQQQPVSIIKFVNQLLYTKGQGTDTCARPWALRTKQELATPCFALGYLDKVQSFMHECQVRNPQTAVEETQKFIKLLMAEITSFFVQQTTKPKESI